ncbi:hypothetical protein Taro_025898 [Colocasia esculenta]|uniref:Uncharacterized protein n=1 Tax=Colocasia esculenta TaxID=4460 RepID=A0A843VIY6_COLES|nr:hypothetical protein [Colocasia esculenta]
MLVCAASLDAKKMMDRHNVLRKLTEYVPQEGELAVEIFVKLWFALLCSCFFFPTSGRSGLLSILPYLDDLHEMKSANWAAVIHEYLILVVQQCQEHVKVYLEVNELLRVSKQQREVIKLQTDLLQRQNNILQSMDQRLHRLEEQFERQPQWQHPPVEPQSVVLVLPPPELPIASVPSHVVAKTSTRCRVTARRTLLTRSRRSMSEWQTSEPKEQRKKGRKEEAEENKRKEEEKKRKEEEEAERKRKEEEEAEKRKEEEEVERKRKEEEEEQKRKEEEEEEQKRKEEEEAERKRKEEEEKQKRKEEEEAEEKKRNPRQIFPSSLSRRVTAGTRKRRQLEIYTPEDYRYHKATKANVSTSKPIFVDSQESTDTLSTGKKEERRDYVAREVLGVDENDLMFGGTLEGYDNFLSFKDIQDLLFARESESVIIDCYVNTCLFLPRQENPNIFKTFGYMGAALKGYVQSSKDDKSKFQHFDYSFRRLDRAPTEFDSSSPPCTLERTIGLFWSSTLKKKSSMCTIL